MENGRRGRVQSGGADLRGGDAETTTAAEVPVELGGWVGGASCTGAAWRFEGQIGVGPDRARSDAWTER